MSIVLGIELTVDIILTLISLIIIIIAAALISFTSISEVDDIEAALQIDKNTVRTHSLGLAFMSNYNSTDYPLKTSRTRLTSVYFSLNSSLEDKEFELVEGKKYTRQQLGDMLERWNTQLNRKGYVIGDRVELGYSDPGGRAEYVVSDMDVGGLKSGVRDQPGVPTGVKIPVPLLSSEGSPESVRSIWINAGGSPAYRTTLGGGFK